MRRLALALDDTQVMRDRDRQAEIDRQRGREEENEERESVREGRDRDRVSLESLPFQIVRSHTVSLCLRQNNRYPKNSFVGLEEKYIEFIRF